MDIFTLKALTDEISKEIVGAFVRKIHHSDTELYFKLSKRNLYIDLNPSNQCIFLTDEKFPSRETPTSFCMILRKHLQNRKIEKLTLPVFYRIVEISFSGGNKLILKFTGRAYDCVLCDENYRIIYSLKEGKVNDTFRFPEVKIIKDFQKFKEETKFEGLPPFAKKELIYIKNTQGVEKAWEFYRRLVEFNIEFEPIEIDGKIYPFVPLSLSSSKKEVKRFSKFNDVFKFSPSIINEIETKLKQKISKINKTLETVKEELASAKLYKKYEKYGELLKANISTLGNESLKNSVKVFDYEENIWVDVPVDNNLSYIENMKRYFEKAKKLKRAIPKLEERIKELEGERNYYEDMLFFLKRDATSDDIRYISEILGITKKSSIHKKESSPFEKIIINGKTVYVGKNARGNDYILRHFGKPDFAWCHAREVPGAHVIVCENLDKLDEETLKKACQIALERSKAKSDMKGEVIYTKVKYLKKVKGAPPGAVFVSKEKTMNVRLP